MTASATAGTRPGVVLDWKTRLAITVGGLLVALLGRTWRVRTYGRDAQLRPSGYVGPVVYTLWHGQMLSLLWRHTVRTGVLVSEHKDGEIITRILEQFGMFGVRGSSSRGGTRALLEAVQVVKGGTHMAFTPDGPRGPRHSFAPGALILAHRAAVPIVTITAHVDRVWRFGSWDAFELPKPFARITVLYGEPRVVQGDDVRAAAERAAEFTQYMHEDRARADVLAAGGARTSGTPSAAVPTGPADS
ncbi:lysophospholipid acyltransferase family protein [Gemmatimonas phototrophica]|uniref:lysophospholipid acyltransferase family protein n=1 Tax=Gemmatimonas phototrophica TaxID=1379270 RepID=UPI0006A6F549|nr:lysophospholipid acyltransferase family protein [Gemmatimonas phototrophica]